MNKSALSIIFFLLFFIFQGKSQSKGIFQYEHIERKDKSFKSHVTFYNLNITNSFSTYSQIYSEELDEKYTEENDEGISEITVIKPKKDEMKIVYNNFENNQSFFKDIVAFDKIYIQENDYKIEWKLFDETKKYGNRICRKASTKFRGRTYIAWFLPEIKINVGPWKFKNVPGLIYEIYDIDNILHIKLIKFNFNKQSNINPWKLENNKKIINLKDYIKLKKYEQDKILERLNARLPNGSKPFIKNKEQQDIEIFN